MKKNKLLRFNENVSEDDIPGFFKQAIESGPTVIVCKGWIEKAKEYYVLGEYYVYSGRIFQYYYLGNRPHITLMSITVSSLIKNVEKRISELNEQLEEAERANHLLHDNL